MASDEDLQIYCQPCDKKGTRHPTHGYCTDCKEHLCETCFQAHKINKFTKRHTFLDATSMAKVLQQLSTPTHTGQSDVLTSPCHKHPQEMIKFYCNDHTELLCSVCVTLEHQVTSCKVNYIPDISGDIIDSKEYQVILNAVNTTSDKFQQIFKDVKDMTHKSNSSLKDALIDIKKFRQEINQRLDELERQVEDAAKVIKQENKKHLKAAEEICEDITKSLKKSSDKIKQLNTTKQAEKLFIDLKLAEKTIKDMEEKLQTCHHLISKSTTFNQMMSRHFSCQGEICVMASKDKITCYITGMTLLTPDLLIITDYFNNAVKMVDTSSQSVSDQLQLDAGPQDITRFTSSELAVILPDIQTIQFISISSNKLIKKHTIKVGGECRSISCYQGKLVVSLRSPAKLQILDMNGTILTTIDGKNIFKDPWYITCNRSSIYVSDCDMKTITKLNWQGEVIGSYSGMGYPTGMSLSDDGTVFVCDNGNCVIEEISGNCSTGKVVLQDLKRPWANMAVSGKKASKQFSSSTTSMASDEDLQVYCQPCDEEGTRLPAHGYCTDCKEHLCMTCFKAHKINKFTKKHTLLDATSMPKVLQQPSTSIHTGLSDDLTMPCPKHPKEMIKFYCNDHTEFLCCVCVTLEHQATSCKVNYIPDISGDIIDSKEYQVILNTLNTTSDKFQQILKDVKDMTHKSNSSLKDALVDIKMFRQEINQRLDELERQAEDAAKVIEQENNKHLKAAETTCEEVTKSLKISSDKIKQLNTTKQADKLFIDLKLSQETIKDMDEKLLKLSSFDIKEHNFQSNDVILNLIKTEKSLGTLTQKTLNKECQPVQIKSRQSSYEGKICVKTSKDKNTCWITGMTLLTPDLLIITDCNNNAVKMVDTSSQSVSDQLQLDDRSWDITRVTSTELAVTLPNKQTIQFISISSNKLIKRHTIKVGGECRGIVCYQGNLVVSFCNPTKLQTLDMNDTILTTIDGKNIFKDPWYIICNRSSIYVSDCKKKTVTRLNWQGDVIGSYSGMSYPTGMSLSDDGTVFVCDWERGVIEEISGDCSTGKVMLQNLKRPWAVCLCRETKKLYYSCYTLGEKYGNYLHIYNLA
ncbi:uncharacterized protein LOC132731221 [Ruditapes philippinarum]|uniref:uncharacterized protein LOC132731221 n=1 Tax=Ruditapes philippinarum TaxID=129788 RepID=UPI00295AB4E8|nr:uncharacterized protein LOC132731221 [Ruditapes philippinarum]